MKVILQETVEGLGHVGDLLDVSDGFARNYLLPRRKALEASNRNVKALEHTKRVTAEKARNEKPDLIVLDIMMPKLDGYETCKMLKSDESTRNIPVILLSAKGRNVDQKVGFEAGADDYITKPFSPRKLVERINAILGQTSSQRMQA